MHFLSQTNIIVLLSLTASLLFPLSILSTRSQIFPSPSHYVVCLMEVVKLDGDNEHTHFNTQNNLSTYEHGNQASWGCSPNLGHLNSPGITSSGGVRRLTHVLPQSWVG